MMRHKTKWQGYKAYIQRLLLILILAVFGVAFATPPASALDPNQMKLYQNNILHFNYYATEDECRARANVVEGERIKTAFKYFVEQAQGLTPEQSAGIVGNLMAESGVDPASNQANGPGRGIAQWSEGGRWDTNGPVNNQPGNLVVFATQEGKDVNDLILQLDFVWLELNNGYAGTLAALRQLTTPEEAALEFMRTYEVPEGYDNPDSDTARERKQNAIDVLARYGNEVGGGTSVVTEGCRAFVNCDNDSGGTSTAKEALLCHARKFDPWGYVMGGGHEDPEQFMTRWEGMGGFDFNVNRFKQVLDCSGLINVAFWNAYGSKVLFEKGFRAGDTTAEMESLMGTISEFEEIPISESTPGDLVWRPGETGHIEIVSSPGARTTFGAHTSNTTEERQIGESSGGNWQKAYTYVGGTGGGE